MISRLLILQSAINNPQLTIISLLYAACASGNGGRTS
jgi:hypothetical protein